jgi:hypothetical protein
MKITIEFSTGKKIELTMKEFLELREFLVGKPEPFPPLYKSSDST